MIHYEIQKPVWNTESIGITDRRLVSGATMAITISYTDAQGNLVYPHKYVMACSKMRKYPTQVVKGGVVLHIIPIADFDTVE